MISRRALLCLCTVVAVPAVAPAGERSARVEASSGAALREWSGRVDRLLASGEIAVRLTRDDTMIPGAGTSGWPSSTGASPSSGAS